MRAFAYCGVSMQEQAREEHCSLANQEVRCRDYIKHKSWRLSRFREKGVGFVSVQEAFDTTAVMGRAMLGVAAVFAQLTREMISENTKDGLLRRVT